MSPGRKFYFSFSGIKFTFGIISHLFIRCTYIKKIMHKRKKTCQNI